MAAVIVSLLVWPLFWRAGVLTGNRVNSWWHMERLFSARLCGDAYVLMVGCVDVDLEEASLMTAGVCEGILWWDVVAMLFFKSTHHAPVIGCHQSVINVRLSVCLVGCFTRWLTLSLSVGLSLDDLLWMCLSVTRWLTLILYVYLAVSLDGLLWAWHCLHCRPLYLFICLV